MQIIGKGGLAKEVSAYLMGGNSFFENEEIDLAWTGKPTVIAIGNPQTKKKIAEKYNSLYYCDACCPIIFGRISGEVKIGVGVVIAPGSELTTDIDIGDHVYINLCVTVGHDTKIGKYSTINPSANISGNVTIGECCLIGTNATILEKVTICDNVIIGAGAVVVKDITEAGTYVGCPAKKIK